MSVSYMTRPVLMGGVIVPMLEAHDGLRVVMKPVVEQLGLSWTAVFQMIHRRYSPSNMMVDRENVTVPMVTLSPSEFFKWVLAARMDDAEDLGTMELRSALVAYVEASLDALGRLSFTRG